MATDKAKMKVDDRLERREAAWARLNAAWAELEKLERGQRQKGHTGRLHAVAREWLADRANPESEGGMGVFADTLFCESLTSLLRRVDRAARRGVKKRRST